MKFIDFKEAIESIYAHKFPNSKLKVSIYSGFGKSIIIQAYLAKDETECISNYFANDMFLIQFDIDVPKSFNPFCDEMPDNIVLNCMNNTFKIKPSNGYCYYDSQKIPFRKVTGDVGKIIKAFAKFVDRMYDTLVEDINSNIIHPCFTKMVKEKVLVK